EYAEIAESFCIACYGEAFRPASSKATIRPDAILSGLHGRLCHFAILEHFPQQLAGAGFRDVVHELDLPGRLVDRHPVSRPVDDVLFADLADAVGLEHDHGLD